MGALRVAVVGSGPSGAYCAQLLTEESEIPVEVDVFERLPAPYGLVRYGVAPDHPRIKSITSSFAQVFEETQGVRFLGNVEVGRDISLDELREHYDAVVFASGAPLDRSLGIPGEDLKGVHAVREFVSWYQGHPDVAPDAFILDGDRAVVIGVGNVALDAARMLVRTTEELRLTDVPEHVVEAFAASTIREVVVIGRRGPEHAKFTNKEFIELLDVASADVVVDPADLELDDVQQAYVDANPAQRRLLATFAKAAERGVLGRPKQIRFVFGRTPLEFLGERAVSGVRLGETDKLVNTEQLDASLVLRSVGYKGRELAGLPYDARTGTIPHASARVEGIPGVYVAGWIKRGPTGVVGTNRSCALETVGSILEDAAQLQSTPSVSTAADVDALLSARGVQVVDWSAWQWIEEAERAAGSAVGRERVKLHDRLALLAAAQAPVQPA